MSVSLNTIRSQVSELQQNYHNLQMSGTQYQPSKSRRGTEYFPMDEVEGTQTNSVTEAKLPPKSNSSKSLLSTRRGTEYFPIDTSTQPIISTSPKRLQPVIKIEKQGDESEDDDNKQWFGVLSPKQSPKTDIPTSVPSNDEVIKTISI